MKDNPPDTIREAPKPLTNADLNKLGRFCWSPRTSKYNGVCAVCGIAIPNGDILHWSRHSGNVYHPRCLITKCEELDCTAHSANV